MGPVWTVEAAYAASGAAARTHFLGNWSACQFGMGAKALHLGRTLVHAALPHGPCDSAVQCS